MSYFVCRESEGKVKGAQLCKLCRSGAGQRTKIFVSIHLEVIEPRGEGDGGGGE